MDILSQIATFIRENYKIPYDLFYFGFWKFEIGISIVYIANGCQ